MLRLHFPTGDLIIDHRSALAPVRSLQCLDSEDEVRRLLLLSLNDPAALDRLRRFWAQWHSESWRVTVINDRRLIERVARMCVNGPLAAFAVHVKPALNTSHVAEKLATGAQRRRQPTIGAAQPVSVANPNIGAPKPVYVANQNIGAPKPVFLPGAGATAPPSASTLRSDALTPSDIAMMSTEVRLEQVLRRTSARLPLEMQHEFRRMLENDLVVTVGVLSVWAGVPTFGIGFIVDSLLSMTALASLGTDIIDASEQLRELLELTLQANEDKHIEEAAKLLGEVVTILGVNAFAAMIAHGATRTVSSAVPGKGPERPRPEPPPPPRPPKRKEKPAPPKKKTYPTAEAAAVAAMKEANPKSVKEGREYGGWVHKNSDGTFSYDPPVKGSKDGLTNMPDKGPNDVVWYHTHGAPDPGYDNENFSGADGDKGYSKANNATGYLATPSGVIKKYDPTTDTVTTLGDTAPP